MNQHAKNPSGQQECRAPTKSLGQPGPEGNPTRSQERTPPKPGKIRPTCKPTRMSVRSPRQVTRGPLSGQSLADWDEMHNHASTNQDPQQLETQAPSWRQQNVEEHLPTRKATPNQRDAKGKSKTRQPRSTAKAYKPRRAGRAAPPNKKKQQAIPQQPTAKTHKNGTLAHAEKKHHGPTQSLEFI